MGGDNFYRLKEIDLDGSAMYSQVKKVVFGEEAARFDIVTNPVVNDVQLGIRLPSTQKLVLQIRDVNGQLILKKEYLAGKGNTTIWIPVEHLAKGTYIISIQSKKLHGSKAFVKQ